MMKICKKSNCELTHFWIILIQIDYKKDLKVFNKHNHFHLESIHCKLKNIHKKYRCLHLNEYIYKLMLHDIYNMLTNNIYP